MSDATVSTALVAVRRHLWREDALLAMCRAGWICAAATLFAVVVHLLARPVPVAALLVVLVLILVAMLAWAAAHPPSDPDCAWWIDRHLGGASAFTTWLDATTRRPTAENARAVAWMQRWAVAKVPEVLRSLAGPRPTLRVAPSMLSMIVCTLLALLVLMLPQEASSPLRQNSAGVAQPPGDKAATAVDAPVVAQVASEIAGALRSSDSPREPDRGRPGGAPGPGTTANDDGSGSPDAPSTSGGAGNDGTSRDPPSASRDPTASTGPSPSAAGSVAGREAGDSPDTRGDVGPARVPGGTILAHRIGSRSRSMPTAIDRQADMAQQADFDDGIARPGRPMTNAMPTAAAATPPPAADTAALSPSETSYVQAWMKATGPGR